MSANMRGAVERLSTALAADPANARAQNAPATARLSARLLTDMRPAMGGEASGPNPGWLLRGALASGTATRIKIAATPMPRSSGNSCNGRIRIRRWPAPCATHRRPSSRSGCLKLTK